MRLPALIVSLAATFGLSGCAVSSPGQSSSATWTTGFWFWGGTSTREVRPEPPVDVLFVQVGTIRGEHVYGEWPEDMPDAKEYWMVYRYDRQAVPDSGVALMLANQVSRLWRLAKLEHIHVTGVQLDIDSPTSQLTTYASFLREVRKGLPQDCQLSITALLDWFRSGTNVSQVIRIADEFVPQFYDTADDDRNRAVIASRIDAAHWGPVFNSFGKRFRLGISSFGRAQMIHKEVASPSPYRGIEMFGDLAPLDIALNRSFHLEATRNPANEVVLNYTTSQKIKISYTNFNPGDGIRFVLATPDSIRTAVESARKIKGNMAGVLFFRWPADGETLAMQPDEVLAAAGIASQGQPARNRVETIDGQCAAVECVDVYLKSGSPFSSSPARYRIRASAELEYFLPEKNMPVRLRAPAELELSLPPYCARGRLFLGRAVSVHHSDFTVEEEQ
jgi:hypothetical protein